MSSSPTYIDPIVIPLIRGRTILDVGCGFGRWGALISSNYWEAGLKKKPVVDGIDAFAPNVAFCAKLPYYRNVQRVVLPAQIKGTWDTVIAIDVLEHIPQKKMLKALDILEQAAGKRIIVSTPNWPAYREGGHTDLGFNEYEAHLSYVSRKLLRERGYTILGAGFGNPDSFLVKWAAKRAAAQDARASGGKKGHEEEDMDYRKSGLRRLRFTLETVPRMLPSQAVTIVAFKDIG